MNVMIDLETMGTNSNAAVVSIGAVSFETNIRATFYTAVDLESCCKLGGIIDKSTVEWWQRQPKSVRDSLGVGTIEASEAIRIFNEWFAKQGNMRSIKVWGNGADFDNVILANMIKRSGAKVPWLYYNNRCFRTLKNLLPIQIPFKGEKHNALNDAVYQAEYTMAVAEKNGLII